MADLNHVMIIGRMTRDAELKYTNTGFAISNFSIAVNRRRKNGEQWVEEVSYFEINLYGKPAESLKPYLTKGKQIAVDGELRQDRWEQDGQTRSKIVIVANNIQLLGGNGGSNTGSSASYGGADGRGASYNQPAAGSRNQYQPRYQEESHNSYDASEMYGGDSNFPEDIPF